VLAFGMLPVLALSAVEVRQGGTLAPAYSCDGATPMAATPAMDHGSMGGMGTGTPMAGMEIGAEFDQLYIDMMIPHHASIVAMAQASLPRLTDERLQEIAQTIINTQTAEVEDLRGYREQFYGSAEPMPLDEPMMGQMMQAMPGMGSMEAMAVQMDPVAQVAAFCSAADPDLAFIDNTIAHHEMAITASEAALEQATHPEIASFAQRVIEDQQAEVDELTAIRADLHHGSATPTGSPGAVGHGEPVTD
jgi:uncharacterized protein (DUF305 family)